MAKARTAKQRAALRKAQLASARKRRGRGKSKGKSKLLRNHTKTALLLGGAALADRAINRGVAKAVGASPPRPSMTNRVVLYGAAGYLAGRAYGKGISAAGKWKKNRKNRKKKK